MNSQSGLLNNLNKLFPVSVIGFPITANHIETSHPLYKNGEATGVVIVRFSSRDVRNQLFYNKKHLKVIKSKVVITEHLTPVTLSLVNYAQRALGQSNVWTSQTKVFAKIPGSKRKFLITRREQVDELTSFNNFAPTPTDSNLQIPAGMSNPASQGYNTNVPENWPDMSQASLFHNMTKRQQNNFFNHSNDHRNIAQSAASHAY